MIRVYQTKFVDKHGTGNCMNACIASLLERPLDDVAGILPEDDGVWWLNWKKWLAKEGYRLELHPQGQPPMGYAIASIDTDRVFPDGHESAGKPIRHACIVFDGMMTHDPYPKPNPYGVSRVHHYYSISPLNS
jgi:hypothetical protein